MYPPGIPRGRKSGSRKERRERTGDKREKEKERSREAEKERKGNAGGRKTEQIPRKVALRETADAMTRTQAYALTIVMAIALAAAKERNVTGQLSRELLKFLINPANLSIR